MNKRPLKATLPCIALLTHADTDLMMLSRALPALPADFPAVIGLSLQQLDNEQCMEDWLSADLSEVRIIVVRVLGRLSNIAGFDALRQHAQLRGQHLIVLSGTGELNPEFTAVSTVAPTVLHQALSYFQAGGTGNIAQLLRFLADHLLLTGFGSEPANVLPEHGIYHPDLAEQSSLSDWLRWRKPDRPSVGITFYRAHWLSGNLGFIDALVREIESRGMNALPLYTASLRTLSDDAQQRSVALDFLRSEGVCHIEALINTTSFAVGDVNPSGPTLSGWSVAALTDLNVPVFQAITSSMEQHQWQSSVRGLNPLDAAMNVVMPEFDGRIVTVPISFKERREGLASEQPYYQPLQNRVARVVGIVARFVRLRQLANADKRIAFIFTNSNSKASQIGNAVGLDAPASLMAIFNAMQAVGYRINNLPTSADQLIHNLIDRASYDQHYLSAQQCRDAVGRVSAKQYAAWFAQLPDALQTRMVTQWGDPPGEAYLHDDHLLVAGLELGNAFVALQPPRGYGMDLDAIYHQPDLPPTHHYYALYRWLSDTWGADAIVHVGKHGTLEWLPGKGVGLSADCFPDALLGDMPLFYPFILNDPGEGSQAKRRAHAVIVDHLTPPMTAADTYGALAQLGQLVDEYYQVEIVDPAKLPLLQQQIWELVKAANLDTDLKAILSHEHDDHDHEHEDEHEHCDHHAHEWNDELTAEGVPVSLAEMGGVDFAHLIENIDGYLCEIGAAQIRDGLHILGQAPRDMPLVDMLTSLTRLPNLDVPGLQAEVAHVIGLELNHLLQDKGQRLAHVPDALTRLADRAMVTKADALEVIDALCNKLYVTLHAHAFNTARIEDSLGETFGDLVGNYSRLQQTLHFACERLVPNLARTPDEIDNLLRGLAGEYIPAGPSGAPTRGMAHILPTGRNFYSVDPRNLPSHSAWRVGQQLAHEVLQRHLKETGHYPQSLSISVWGTSAMRTHGDDVAEILSLLGVRPVWQAENRRVTGIEVVPLNELGRPRIDVTVRISGFFRDAFPHLIDLVDQAVQAVILLDETPEQNFVRKHYLEELAQRLAKGMTQQDAEQRSQFRIFGAKPGSYGAGILPLINEKHWHTDADFAEAYVNWGGYAYTQYTHGLEAKDDFRQRLASVDVALHNQDNREHDIFDSDDYLQFHGGMIATIRSLTGRQPRHYFGDTQDPNRAVVRDLKEEALRVFRSRVVNPKWLQSIQRHGYKGGLELTATVDYLFGYDATAALMEDWMYESVAEHYALDPQMQQFFADSNPWALNAIAERLLEAAQRNLWVEPKADTLQALQQVYLSSETQLEARGEKSRHTP